MSSEIKKEIELEIAYVLFIDIVGYSKLLINDQRRHLETLNQIVRGTEQVQKAEANHRYRIGRPSQYFLLLARAATQRMTILRMA